MADDEAPIRVPATPPVYMKRWIKYTYRTGKLFKSADVVIRNMMKEWTMFVRSCEPPGGFPIRERKPRAPKKPPVEVVSPVEEEDEFVAADPENQRPAIVSQDGRPIRPSSRMHGHVSINVALRPAKGGRRQASKRRGTSVIQSAQPDAASGVNPQVQDSEVIEHVSKVPITGPVFVNSIKSFNRTLDDEYRSVVEIKDADLTPDEKLERICDAVNRMYQTGKSMVFSTASVISAIPTTHTVEAEDDQEAAQQEDQEPEQEDGQESEQEDEPEPEDDQEPEQEDEQEPEDAHEDGQESDDDDVEDDSRFEHVTDTESDTERDDDNE